jgi:type I restriction enzyme M protein
VQKGRPKNFIPEDAIRPLAAAYLKGESVEGEIAVITRQQAEEADYNLSPSKWVDQNDEISFDSIPSLLAKLESLQQQDAALIGQVLGMLTPLTEKNVND